MKPSLFFNDGFFIYNHMFENRRWLVIPTSELQNVNFDEVHETSSDTCRLSVNGEKTFIKYDIEVINDFIYGRPSIYNEIYTEYTHSEILVILNTNEWKEPSGQ